MAFDAFIEAEPDSEPEVVYKAYDQVKCEAVIQLSSGSTVKADSYTKGPRGFVIAGWEKLDEILETDASNMRLRENTIQKAVLVPGDKVLPMKRNMKRPATAPAPSHSVEGAPLTPAKKPAAASTPGAPKKQRSKSKKIPEQSKKAEKKPKPSKTTDNSPGEPKESQRSPYLKPEFANKWQKTLDLLPLGLWPQSNPKGDKNYTIKTRDGYSIQVYLVHEALYLKPVKFTEVKMVDLGLDNDMLKEFGFKNKYTRDKHGGVYVRWGTSPQLAYDMVQLMALHDTQNEAKSEKDHESGESHEGEEQNG